MYYKLRTIEAYIYFDQYNLIFYNYFSDKNLPSGFPRIKQNPKMKVVEKGRNAILVCEAEGDPPVNIYWVKDSIRLRRDPRFTVMQQGKLRGERVEFFCVVIRKY